MVAAWQKSDNIRAFLKRVEEKAIQKSESLDPNGELARWIEWARKYAESIDPT